MFAVSTASSSLRRRATYSVRHALPVRVCHVSMCLKTGGLERLLVEFARRHDRTQYQPLFVALQDIGPPAEDIAAAKSAVFSLDLERQGKWRALCALRRILKGERVAVVHTHNTYAHFYGTLAAKWAGAPVVINTQHGRGCGTGWKARMQFRLANRLADRVAGVSRDATDLCRSQDRRSAYKIDPVWNGIDVERFAYHGPVTDPVAIAVARLSPEKDFPTLLSAYALAVQGMPALRLRIVGDGSERPALEAQARQLGLVDRIEFLGERRDVPQLLREAAVFVSSSLTEGISLTFLEAMAVGLPIVATRVGGNPEIVEDGVTGRLVPPRDTAALAEALVETASNRTQQIEFGRHGRRRVESEFHVDRMVRDYEQIYSDCLSSICGND